MARHFGIVGVSPEGTALCYREIFRYARRVLGEHGHPAVTIHNLPFEQYVEAARRDDWPAVGDLLRRSADLLAAAGAEFCIVPDNLMQHGIHWAESGSRIPFLAMTDLVAEAVVEDRRGVVGLIGTRQVMSGSTYQTVLGLRGIRVLAPDDADADAIDRIIYNELVYGLTRRESTQAVADAVRRLADRGCEGLILGLSEGGLLLGGDALALPVYDAVGLLAQGALRRSLG